MSSRRGVPTQTYPIVVVTWENAVVRYEPIVVAAIVCLLQLKVLYCCGSPLAMTMRELYMENFESKLLRHKVLVSAITKVIRNFCDHDQRFNVEVDYSWPQLKVLIVLLKYFILKFSLH